MRPTIVLIALCCAPLPSWAQTISVPHTDKRTTYTRPYNWGLERAQYYYSTTVHGGNCLDNSRQPDGTRAGSAITTFSPTAGKYKVEICWRDTDNRSQRVPWRVSSDGIGLAKAEGVVNQKLNPSADLRCQWHTLAEASAVDVLSSIRVEFGAWDPNYHFDKNSISYGGVRITRVGATTLPDMAVPRDMAVPPPPPDLAVPPLPPDLASTPDDAAAPEGDLAAPPATDGQALPDAAVPPVDGSTGKSADGGAREGDGGGEPQLTEGGCRCSSTGGPPPWGDLGLALAVLLLLRRRAASPRDEVQGGRVL